MYHPFLCYQTFIYKVFDMLWAILSDVFIKSLGVFSFSKQYDKFHSQSKKQKKQTRDLLRCLIRAD